MSYANNPIHTNPFLSSSGDVEAPPPSYDAALDAEYSALSDAECELLWAEFGATFVGISFPTHTPTPALIGFRLTPLSNA